MRWSVLSLLIVWLVGARALANAPEDMFGVSARVSGMGGAGTAISRDGFAAYSNPAGLARCPDSHAAVDFRQIAYGLNATRTGADAPPDAVAPLRGSTRMGLAACLLLPRHFAIGVAFTTSLQEQGAFNMPTGRAAPVFPLYGSALDYPNINAAIAYRPIRQISIGIGASVLAGVRLPVRADVPVGQLDENANFRNLTFRMTAEIAPRIAPYIGVLVEPSRRFRVGATYRARLSLGFDSAFDITTTFLGWEVPLPIVLTGQAWYSPNQVAIAVAGEPTPNITLTADATWYGYGELRRSSYPYLNTSLIPGSMGSVLPLVGVPNPDPPDYRSAYAVRLGGEARLLDSRRLAVRGGYALRTSALPLPGSRNTTLLDGATHSFTLGMGYALNTRWDDSSDSHDAPAQVGGASAPHAATSRPTQFTARFDAYGRLTVMPQRTDPVKDLRYGGHMIDLGLTMTLGWR